MIHPARRIALVVAASIAIGVGSVSPAFAKGGGEGEGSSTTVAGAAPTTKAPERPTTTRAPRPSTSKAPEAPSTSRAPEKAPSTSKAPEQPSTTRAKGTAVGPMLDQLIVKVQGSKADDATKAALIERINAMKAPAAAGTIDTAAMQQLIRDVGAAVGTQKGSDDRSKDAPKTTEAPHAGTTEVEKADDEKDDADHAAKPENDKAEALALLDRATAKVTESALPDADKAALLEKIAAVRAKVDAGAAMGHEELGQLMGSIRGALAKVTTTATTAPEGSPATTHAERHGSATERAIQAIDEQIAKIASSKLPDDVKAQAIAALADAKNQIAANGLPDSTEVSDHIKQRKATRMEVMTAKLVSLSDRVAAQAYADSSLPNSADAVALARVNVGKARRIMALAATPQDLRAAFDLLREARLALRSVEVAASNATSTTSAPAVATTVAAPVDTTVAVPVDTAATAPVA
jgi:hypothetical protein